MNSSDSADSELFIYDFDEEQPCGIVIREKNPAASSAPSAASSSSSPAAAPSRGGAPKAFKEKATADFTGWTIWSSSVLLCRWILANRGLLKGKRVLELGSGCGLVGAMLAFHTEAASVTLTDYQPDTLANLQHNIAQNKAALAAHTTGTAGAAASVSSVDVRCLALDWDDEDKFASFGKFDVILVSDATYRRSYARKLAVVVDALLADDSEAEGGGGGLFVYASPVAREGLPVLVSILKDRLDYQDVREEPVPVSWRTNPLRSKPLSGREAAGEPPGVRFISDEEAKGLFPELGMEGYEFEIVTATKRKPEEAAAEGGRGKGEVL